MNERRVNRWLQIAVVVPVVGLVGLIARAEFGLRSGPSFRIPIAGFDPRDLLHGHYFSYQYAFNWQGASNCGSERESVPQPTLDPACCLCLTRVEGSVQNPEVRQVWCEEARTCDGWLRTNFVQPPLRYFVPEDRAEALEKALQDRKASLELNSDPRGQPRIHDLYLDDRPWRDALGTDD